MLEHSGRADRASVETKFYGCESFLAQLSSRRDYRLQESVEEHG